MDRILFSALVVCTAATTVIAQPANTPIVNIEQTRANGQKVLLGHCSPSVMQLDAYREWYERSYQSYDVDPALVAELTPLLNDKTIEIFAGSWCGDTRREIPRLMKILEAADMDTNRIELIFVDNAKELYKQSPQHEEAGKYIHHVPTIIVYEGEREINRITEKPVDTLEADLLAILSGQPYTPLYHSITVWQQTPGIDEKLDRSTLEAIAARLKGLPANARELNSYAVALSSLEKVQEAINVLEVNSLLYPDDATSRDNLDKLRSPDH